ncbi:MAG: hemolysin III family protein [Gammaproteobacteria bacterium]|nr:hemolysin III family protein [Gammaproteobacteria bacterium]
MQSLIKHNTRIQSRKEEYANGISHGLGLIAAIVATPLLIIKSIESHSAGFIVGTSIFCASMILLYLSSTIYHLLTHAKTKGIFNVIDHSAIFLLIAGTYTPFTLGALHGAWGWSLFGVIWGIAAFGITLKIVRKKPFPILSTTLYLLMGWIVVVAVKPLFALLPIEGIAWLAGGGVLYSLGVIFFVLDARLHYAHFIWHLFVLAGTVCHALAIYWYAA